MKRAAAAIRRSKYAGKRSRDDAVAAKLLRQAGCKCERPLVSNRPGEGPRCRLCNVVAKVKQDG